MPYTRQFDEARTWFRRRQMTQPRECLGQLKAETDRRWMDDRAERAPGTATTDGGTEGVLRGPPTRFRLADC